MKILYRVLQIASGAICIGWFLLLSSITNSPRQIDQNSGHVISHTQHGTTVYITALQYWLLYAIMPVGGITIIGSTLLVARRLKIAPAVNPYEKLNAARIPPSDRTKL